jgi:hypothetical protein
MGHRSAALGIGQLTLVEHALCPLDSRRSLVKNLVHNAVFFFTDGERRRCRGKARVVCPAGLSAADEFYLWGLLAIALSEPDPHVEFHATPHYCLRRLGVIDQHDRRGGRQYGQFLQAVERLSLVHYRNDAFYDPIRGEHRRVSFGFLSYSLPIDPESSRAWRFGWDPIFFGLVRAAGGHLRFNLAIYRQLDPASRRLYLFLSKLFHRRATARVDLQLLAVEILGFAPTIAPRNLKAKVGQCSRRLVEFGILSGWHWERAGKGKHTIVFSRGQGFTRCRSDTNGQTLGECSVADPLRTIGFDERAIRRLVRRYPMWLLREWVDITLAAKERHGSHFFKRSPQAFLIDNLQNAAAGRRTPPDWWYELRKSEERVSRPAKPQERQGVPTTVAQILHRAAGDTDAPLNNAVRSFVKRQT